MRLMATGLSVKHLPCSLSTMMKLVNGLKISRLRRWVAQSI